MSDMKKVISTTSAPAAIGPYSQAVETGNMIFLSGQLPIDPKTGIMPESIKAQTRQAFANIKAILAEAGYSVEHIVKTTVLLASFRRNERNICRAVRVRISVSVGVCS